MLLFCSKKFFLRKKRKKIKVFEMAAVKKSRKKYFKFFLKYPKVLENPAVNGYRREKKKSSFCSNSLILQ